MHIIIVNIITLVINLFISLTSVNSLFLDEKRSLAITLNFFVMAGVLGFEPRQAVLETDVLPLTLCP